VLFGQHFFALPRALRVLAGADCAATSLLVIITRNHYAVDVLLALFITPFVFVAFTRHPALVGLGCLRPEKLLSKPSLLGDSLEGARSGGDRGGLSARDGGAPPLRRRPGCCPAAGAGSEVDGNAGADAGASADASAESRLGDDGYALPRQLDVRLVAESAHAVLRLWGLRPRLLVFRDREALAAYRDGEEDDGLGDEYEGAGGDEGADADADADEDAFADAGADEGADAGADVDAGGAGGGGAAGAGGGAVDAGVGDGPLVLLEAAAAAAPGLAPDLASSRSGGDVLF